MKWFLDLIAFINASGGGGGGAVAHSSTTGLQGGQANQYYHLTATEYTGSGTGTFARVNTPAFTTPALGAATGTSLVLTAGVTLIGGAQFLTTNTALTNGAGVALGTLATAPSAGNPTKWIGINDNGTVRYLPAW